MLFVYNKLKYRKILNIFDYDGKIEACAIEVFIESGPIVLVSCYCPLNTEHITTHE